MNFIIIEVLFLEDSNVILYNLDICLFTIILLDDCSRPYVSIYKRHCFSNSKVKVFDSCALNKETGYKREENSPNFHYFLALS